MKTKHIFTALALGLVANFALAGASSNLPSNPEVGNGIITPVMADGVLTTTGYTYFSDTGKLAVCFERWGECKDKQWQTAEQAVRARFAKATYVGFKLVQTRDGSRVDLYFRSGQ